MSFPNWLYRRTPTETDAPPPVLTAHGEITPTISRDATADHDNAPTPTMRYTLEPYFWMIEYEDSDGDITQRRVTMRTVDVRGGQQYLNAFCHERKAPRMFRLDRIACLISSDGEVEDAEAWFRATLANYEPAEFTPDQRRNTTTPPNAYTTLKRHISPGLILLIAAARSNNILHPREIDRILRFAEDCAFDLRDNGTIPEGVSCDDFDKLERTIRRVRPMTTDVDTALSEIEKWPKNLAKRLFAALTATACADGRVDHIEAGLIEALRDFGNQLHGIGWED